MDSRKSTEDNTGALIVGPWLWSPPPGVAKINLKKQGIDKADAFVLGAMIVSLILFLAVELGYR